jgi:flagellar motility protein MotE (MotC chaperone)
MNILQSNWVVALIGALSYMGTTIALWQAPLIDPLPAPSPVVDRMPKPSWEFLNPEVDQLISDLENQKQALDKRERELKTLAARLETEKSEVGALTQMVAKAQAEFDRHVLRIKEQEVVNLKRLAKIYSTMTPEGAVSILIELPDDELVKQLVHMKDSETAPMLELMAAKGQDQAQRVAKLTSRMRMTLAQSDSPSTQR